MKKAILFFSILSLFISCKKSDDNPTAPEPALLEKYPQKWVFTIDETTDRYTIIRTNLNAMFRRVVDKSYSLNLLVEEENCEFFISQDRSSDGKICFTIQLNKDKKRWCNVSPSTNGQEMHMGIAQKQSEITAPADDGYKFFIHDIGRVNDVKTIALESVRYPGYYLSSSPPGFNYAQNVVTFTKETSPEKATSWYCRHAN